MEAFASLTGAASTLRSTFSASVLQFEVYGG